LQQNPSTKEKDKKVRLFELAKELNLASKDLVACAQELGFAGIKNQLNTLEPEQVDALKERVKKGPKPGTPAPPPGPSKPVIPPAAKLPDHRVQTLPKAPPRPAAARPAAGSGVVAQPAPVQPHGPATPVAAPVVPAPVAATPVAEPPQPVAEPTPVIPGPPPVEPTPAAPTVAAEAAPADVAPIAAPTPPQNVIPTITAGGMRNLTGVRNLNAGRPAPIPPRPATPSGPAPVVPPAAARPEGPGTPSAPRPPVSSTGTPPRPTPPGGPTIPPGPRPAAPAATPPTSGGPVPPRPATTGGGVIPPAGPGGAQRPNFLDRKPQVPPPRVGAPTGGPGAGPRPPAPPPGPGVGGPPPRPGGGSGVVPPAGPRHAGPAGTRPGGPGTSRPGGPAKTGQPMKLTDEMIKRLRDASARGQKLTIEQIAKAPPTPGQPTDRGPGRPGDRAPDRPGGPARPPVGRPDSGGGGEDDDDKKKAPGGGVIGRDARHKGRQTSGRSRGPSTGQPAVVVGPHGQVDIIEQQWGSRKGPRQALLNKMRRRQQQIVVKEGRIEITPPITVRSLSEAIGMKAGELGKRLLKETGKLYGNNSPVELEFAQLVAAEKNIELVLKLQETAEDKLLREFEQMMTNVDPAKLKPRPPIVTIMGHVDHGKTSLLDKIRQNYGLQSDVVSTEAGGITQVIRAWSVKREVEIEKEDGTTAHEERFITFLDTPGHEAFTKMRARGANVTDIAVIVVAATDGVMPQTEEAISHAKAAEVKIVVAINKVDMPNANIGRTKQQLFGQGLIPDDMGGDVQFVETSAVTGQGITDLLDTLVLVAEVEDLKADPDRPATGTCLEAYMSADEGVMATVLVQQGTLNRGDIVLCGSTYGRVRAMYGDLGQPVKTAGPSTPVRITGLNAVPNADDPFYVVGELTQAKEIAEAREQKELEAARVKFAPVSLDNFSAVKAKAKITELKVILKAEARGSVEAIRKELEKLVHEEVRTRVLHAAIGAITESDVQLALTSPDDTLVIGFNVTADDAALHLAEERGISLREYNIIYNLVDDVKAALEGRLKPVEEVVHLGRASVRETFKISKVGTIAGCFVTTGTIERSARVRVIREGVVVYPQGDKVVGLDSLKRFKDDVREVREGYECGLKITGFDDVKVNDVIEAFKIEVKHRTL
jgi:translation initiation factor IF-2